MTLRLPPWPHHAADEIAAVAEVLASGRTNQWTGDRVRAFEQAFAARHEDRPALAVANGTVALEIALRALGIGPGDEVVVTPNSFVASAGCVRIVGATPVFADVDAETQLLTAGTIAPVLTPRTRAAIVVHLNGRLCAMPPILALARQAGFRVIEDCAQSTGATWQGRPAGVFGDAAAFSFCQDKIITTGGEGGMLLFADPARHRRAWSYRDHGKDPALMAAGPGAGYRWVHAAIGSNHRMTEMQAAIGLVQLGKLDAWLATRRRIAARLAAALAAWPALRVPRVPPGMGHACYRLVALVAPQGLAPGWDRDRILAALRARGVGVLSGTCPEIYREQAFADLEATAGKPNARRLASATLTFQVHPTMDEAYLAGVEAAIRAVMAEASPRPSAAAD